VTRRVLGLVVAAGCLDYESFLQKKHDRYCEEMAICNPDFECNVPTANDTGYATDLVECDFDAKLARDCLKGTWTCADPLQNGDPSFMYPVGPEACEGVCGSPGGDP
jgi:hypothetical protein